MPEFCSYSSGLTWPTAELLQEWGDLCSMSLLWSFGARGPHPMGTTHPTYWESFFLFVIAHESNVRTVFPTKCSSLAGDTIDQKAANVLCEGLIVNVLHFVSHVVSLATTQLCNCAAKAAIFCRYTNWCSSVPVRCDLQKQARFSPRVIVCQPLFCINTVR